jgi:sulfite exporter TauE/SafE
MLASINPLGERARNQKYVITVVSYIVGSTIAGALLGAALGLVGAPVAVAAVALAVVGALAAVGILSDARRLGLRVPGPRRQVDENWLVTYRGWVYGSGFGAQLGFAFVTIVTASATWVAFACALLSGSALAGLLIGAIFGLARALPILAGSRIGSDPAALRRVVRRLERVRPRVALTTTAVQGAAAVGLVALAVARTT